MDLTKSYLLENDIKPSVQRIAIMMYLREHRVHPTADEIYKDLHAQIPTLSKTTVYNTLKLFVEKGAILKITIDEKTVRYDGYKQKHAHFRCLRCGNVFDIPLEENIIFPESDETKGFIVMETQVYHNGYCIDCIRKK